MSLVVAPELLVIAVAASAFAVLCRSIGRLSSTYERVRGVPLALLVGLYAMNGAQALFNPLFNWSVVALVFATAGELLVSNRFVAALLCFSFSVIFYALAFQGVAITLDWAHLRVALLCWITAAAWLSRLLWAQQRSLLVPLNFYLVLDAALLLSAYAAERTLRRDMPWLFVAAFHFVLGDAVLFFDEFVAAMPFAALVIPALCYGGHITAAVGVLTLPQQGS
jgi:hypothetical protein